MTAQEISSHHECDFGKWYEGPDGQLLRHVEAFQTVGHHHGKVHSMAAEIVAAVHGKDQSQAGILMAEFEAQREKMFAALDVLYRA